ncbi:MAG: nucleotide exchange factor GrpE [Promethearchaeota archaeon]
MTDIPQDASKPPEAEKGEKRIVDKSKSAEPSTMEPAKPKPLTKKKLQKALVNAQAQVQTYKTQLAYLQADHENFVKAMERREADLRLQANRELLLGLLPILDDLERAQLMIPQIEANNPFIEGLSMLVSNLKSTLTNAGVKVIECKGQPFDPLRHEAVVREESTTHPPNTVIEELRKGYLLKGTLLRPSMVKIAVAPTPPPKTKVTPSVEKETKKN